MKTLIDVASLKELLDSGRRAVLLDVRWALGDHHGREHYLQEHLPGAVFVDLPSELAGPADPTRGRHPLPPLEQFQASVRAWGVRTGDTVVAYDDSSNTAAARLWWMLRNAGLADVYLLDGGLAAWRAAGYGTESGVQHAEPGDIVLSDGALPVIDAGRAATWATHGVLLDARAGERFRGEIEPVDPRAGHIPGRSAPPLRATWTTMAGSFRLDSWRPASPAWACGPASPLLSTAVRASRQPMKSRRSPSPDSPPRSTRAPSRNGRTSPRTRS